MGRSVLVVDDNESVAGALEEALSLLGYTILVARDISEGWRLFRAHSPSAVITDNRMRGEDPDEGSGLDFAVLIKASSPSTRVIMLSALPPARAEEVCDAVLAKPVLIRSLSEALSRLGVEPER